MKLGATLYIENTVEAVEFYRQAFGLTLGYHEKNSNGTYMHAELLKNGNEMFAVSESSNVKFVSMMLGSSLKQSRPTMSYSLNFDTEIEVMNAYELLSKQGTIVLAIGKLPWSDCCAEVVDKYGVYWYITT
ncbi:VOC family protein [Scatolibacter rhodanostii]|uniref:VOC family protein n=1 Tax=Scatolibacter rhodanostii TaxID=2014781 RepID=UPI000C07EC62|nr:VOC family protein [Scatolibacter rhodanostii]